MWNIDSTMTAISFDETKFTDPTTAAVRTAPYLAEIASGESRPEEENLEPWTVEQWRENFFIALRESGR